MEHPHSDQQMTYDILRHKYVLTQQYAYQVLGTPTGTLTSDGDNNNTTQWERFLHRVSDDVYNYIYRDSWSPKYLEFLLAKNKELRPIILDMLTSQVEYCLQNGVLTSFSGVNLKRGSMMPLKELRGDVIVSPTVVMVATSNGLKYLGRLPDVPGELYRVGY